MDSLWFSGCLISEADFFKNILNFNTSQCLCVFFSPENIQKISGTYSILPFFFQSSAMGFCLLDCIKVATLKHICAIYKTSNVG